MKEPKKELKAGAKEEMKVGKELFTEKHPSGKIVAVRPECKMRVCEDPVTGEIRVVYQKNCPKGYIERVAGKIATRGVAFEEEREDEEEKG